MTTLSVSSSRWDQQPLPLFVLLCIVHFVIWTIFPATLQQNGSPDVLEAIAWGAKWQLGYDRDPFLVAWLAQIASWVSGASLWSLYALSQLCIISSFWAVWRLAKALELSDLHALMSVLFLEGVFYYHFTTPEFNDNVLQIPLWALSTLFLYLSITTQRIRYWLLFGAAIALAMLAKYFAVMLCLTIAGLMLTTSQGRQSFVRPGIYCGMLMAFVCFLPNLYWQYQHDWQYIHYALNRAQVESTWLNHISYPLKFALSQLLALSPSLVIFLTMAKPRFAKVSFDNFNAVFLITVALGPILVTVLYSALTGTQIRSMWGTPLFSLVGLFLVYFSRPDIQTLPKLLYGYAAYFIFALVIYIMMVTVSPHLIGYAKNEFYPSRVIATDVTKRWREVYQKPIPYVLGTRRITSAVSVYSKDHPTPYFDLNPATSPWIDEQDILQKGAVVLWDVDVFGKEIPQSIIDRFPEVKLNSIQSYAWQTSASSSAPVTLGIAFLPPAAD